MAQLLRVSLARPSVGIGQARQTRCTASSRRAVRVTSLARSPAAQEGPGSGQRHFPEELGQQYDLPQQHSPQEQKKHHDLLSTEDCYLLFPLITHVSCPLRIEDPEPAGISMSRRVADAGPATGRRRRPAPTDSSTAAHSQVLPFPATRPTDLRRELLVRHAPEVVLGDRRA